VRSACFPATVTGAVEEVDGGESCEAAQCAQHLVRQHAPFVALVLERRHRRERTTMPTASSVVCHRGTSRMTSASYTAFHPAHTSCSAAEASENPKLRLGFSPPSRLQHLQHLRHQLIRQTCPPALHHRLPPSLCSQPRGYWDGEAARRVSARHRPPVMVEVPALRDVFDVWRVCLAAAWEGRHRLIECGATTTRRSPPCCCQLCTL
jgi:hypothetical protein